jgi:hypothetical protein
MRQSENFMQADKTPSKDKELRHAQRERERERRDFEHYKLGEIFSTLVP